MEEDPKQMAEELKDHMNEILDDLLAVGFAEGIALLGVVITTAYMAMLEGLSIDFYELVTNFADEKHLTNPEDGFSVNLN